MAFIGSGATGSSASGSGASDSTLDEFAWKAEALRSTTTLARASDAMFSLEVSLQCEICGELYKSPVFLAACGHTYCSRCIRSALSVNVNSGCPTCRQPATTNDIRPNKAAQAAVANFVAARRSVLAVMQEVVDRNAAKALRRSKRSGNQKSESGSAKSKLASVPPLPPPPPPEPRSLSREVKRRERPAQGQNEQEALGNGAYHGQALAPLDVEAKAYIPAVRGACEIQ